MVSEHVRYLTPEKSSTECESLCHKSSQQSSILTSIQYNLSL
jgi:hypothetical protein